MSPAFNGSCGGSRGLTPEVMERESRMKGALPADHPAHRAYLCTCGNFHPHPNPPPVPEPELGCTCQACGERFTLDLLVPDAIWERISPVQVAGYKGGGLLCGPCIMRRLEKLTGFAAARLELVT